MIYFDLESSLFTLEAQAIEPFRLAAEEEFELRKALQTFGRERWRALTDGSHFYVVPEAFLQQTLPNTSSAAPALEHLQDYFSTEKAVRAALGADHQSLESEDKDSLIYGNTGAQAMFLALKRIAACSTDLFLDIGCGCGLPVLVASHLVKQAHGVDLVPQVIEFARQAALELDRRNVSFDLANVRDFDVQPYDIVYLAATTLSETLRKVIAERLSKLRPGAIVISLTHSLPCPHLVLVDRFECPFAWWKSSTATTHQFHIYLRRAHEF